MSNDPLNNPLMGRSISVSLTVNDIEKSLAWYQAALGFEIDRKFEREGKVMAVSLKGGDARLLLGQDDGARGMDRVKGEGFSFQITTNQNIDDLANRIKSHGSTLDTEPADMPWGQRAFRLRDPDGFKMTISSDIPERR
jgi:uncharacterized glyoxalase superfamily protein PhnB